MGRPIIKEAILDLNESDLACELYKEIINPRGWERDHWSSHHNLAYCIYISSRSEPHRGALLQLVQDKNVYPLQFHRFMILSEPQSLLDTQFLLEFYRRYFQEKTPYSKQGLSPWEALTEMHFKPNSLLD